jgi:phosphatidylserine/phosphatidylglycerophosphate/cardiolipin synthase-like enzyme
MNHKITDTLQRIQGYTDNEEVRGLADKVLEMGRKFVESFPDVGSYETRVTVTLPPNKRIPLEIRGSSLLNEEAEKNVIRDCKEKLYVVTPYLEVEVLQMLLNQSDTSSAECTIITSDEKRIVSDSRNLNKLRTVLKQRFRSAKILFLKDAMIVAHAKIWLCERSVLITSANVMSNSQTNNFEMGVYTDNPQIVKTCDTLISEILPLCKAI